MNVRYVFLAVVMACAVARAEWTLTSSVAEMTDEIRYTATAACDDPDVALRVVIVPTEYCAATDALSFNGGVSIDSAQGFAEGRAAVLVRCDDLPATNATATTSADGRTLRFMNPPAVYAALSAAREFRVRYRSPAGVRTVRFDVAGLADVEKTIKAEVAAKRPKSVESIPAPPRMTTCRRCGGKGEVTAWTKCTRCDGRGLVESARCRQCATSAKRGQVKAKAPCPECGSTGRVAVK